MSSQRPSDKPPRSDERDRAAEPGGGARVPGSIWYLAGGTGKPPTITNLRRWKQGDRLRQERRREAGGGRAGNEGGAYGIYGKGARYESGEGFCNKGDDRNAMREGSCERNRPQGPNGGSGMMSGGRSSGGRGGEHDGSEVEMGRHAGSSGSGGHRGSGMGSSTSEGRRRD